MIKLNFELMGENLKMSLVDAKEEAAIYLSSLRKGVNQQLALIAMLGWWNSKRSLSSAPRP